MKKILQLGFPLIGLAILVLVWSVAVRHNGGLAATFGPGDSVTLVGNLFRLAGLTAFTLVSFQVLTGPYMKLWERLYGPNFYRFHAYEGIAALTFATIHPILIVLYLFLAKLSLPTFAASYPFQYYFGPAAWVLMVITVSTAAATILFGSMRFKKTWHWFHLANYLVFLFGFFHSLTIGADVAGPTSQLRPLWWLFFVGMIIGLVYRRIIRVFLEKNPGLD